jgi:hypothetical protein
MVSNLYSTKALSNKTKTTSKKSNAFSSYSESPFFHISFLEKVMCLISSIFICCSSGGYSLEVEVVASATIS